MDGVTPPGSGSRGKRLYRKLKDNTANHTRYLHQRRARRVKSGATVSSVSSVDRYGSPRSIVSEDTIYYSDDDDHLEGTVTPRNGDEDSDLRHGNVRRHSASRGQESTLVDKVAAWWHSFSLFDDEDRNLLDEDADDTVNSSLQVIVEDDDKVAPGCISLLTAAQVVRAHKKFLSTIQAGKTVNRISIDGESSTSSTFCSWGVPDPTTFMVRSKGYMKDKIKIPCQCSLYKIIECDNFSFDSKVDHISGLVELPKPSETALQLSETLKLPPLLVLHLQMPMYPPTLFGDHNGEQCSLVYYCELNSDCDAPQHAIDMALRLVEDGEESDGQKTRDRLKLLPRIVNVEEWGEKAPLSATELKLVRNYNGKPLLMRPQQTFHHDKDGGYFEIDVNIHKYAYLARRAFYGFIPRLGPAVFENGFVIQGNCPGELPEVLLACARIYRIDFSKTSKFSSALA